MPYISAKIACKFTNIKVNENHEVVAGTVEALTTGMGDMLAEWGKLPTDDDEEEDYTNADNFEGEDITVTGIIKDVKADTTTNTITIIKEDGTTEEYDLSNEAVGEEDNKGGKRFTDEEGNVWVVTPDGDVKQVENGNNIPSTVPDSVKYLIVFEPDADSKYGFDAYNQAKTILPYELRKYNDENYFMPWKSVETGKQDYIKVKEIVKRSSDFPEAIGFKSTVASLTTYNAEKGEKQIAVNAAGKGMTDEVYAYVVKTDSAGNEREEKIGSINVVSYDKVKEKVIIVPVNQASVITEAEIKSALNSIYKQAVAEWDVKMLKEIKVEADYLQSWDSEESGLFASFPAPMRRFNRRCKEIIKDREGSFDKDAYYIFLIGDDISTRSGFMPFKRKYGYVFTSKTKNIAKTIAHELGHGAFRLRHTFTQYPALAKNTTQNLMDYTDGKELYKYQWDFVHDPENMVGWFVDDEEGEMIHKDHAKNLAISIDEFKSRFAPGYDKLLLKYSLNDTTKSLISAYEKEEFWVQLLIFDKNQKLIFSTKREPKKTDTLSFDGFISNSNTPIQYSDGQYTSTINLIGGKNLDGISKISSWTDFKDYIYQKFNEDSVSFISIQKDTVFNIDLDAADFVNKKEKFGVFMEDRVANNYLRFVDDFRKDGYFTDGKSPLKWMDDNGINSNSITFLGMNVSRLTGIFKEVLIETENILKTEYSDVYDDILSQYSGSVSAQSQIRYIQNNCMCNPSNHSLGCAIDIRVAFNPQITASNIEYLNLIKYLTGLDLTKSKKVKEVTDAQIAFMKKIHGNDYIHNKKSLSEVISDYELIYNFDNKAPFSLNIFLNLQFQDVIIDNFSRYKNDVIRVLKAHKNRIVFKSTTIEAIDNLILHLSTISSDTIKRNFIYNLESFKEEKGEFIMAIKGGEISDLSDFITFFKSRNKRLYGNKLLEDGFGDCKLELVKSFLKAHKLISKKYLGEEFNAEWGGTYNSKYDGMHFGMSSAFIKAITNIKNE